MSIYKMSKKTEEETLERMRKRLEKKTTRKLDAIRRRLEAITDTNTNTDEKLENYAISNFVAYGESDVAWLLERVEELMRTGRQVLRALDRDKRAFYVEGMVALRSAILTTDQAEESEDK